MKLNTLTAPFFAKETSHKLNSLTLRKLGHKFKIMLKRKEEDYVLLKRYRTYRKHRTTSSSMVDRFQLAPNQWRSAVMSSMISFLCLDQKTTMDKVGDKLIRNRKS